MSELIVVVDKEDKPLEAREKLEVHKLGLLHRAFSIFIYRKIDGCLEFLLQQRQKGKYHSESLWSNSCCSHPKWGEELLSAGKRRLQEELGFCVDLKEIKSFIYKKKFENGLIEHEYDHVLLGEWQENSQIIPNEEEVQDFCWMRDYEIKEKLSKNPEKFTFWLTFVLDISLDKLKEFKFDDISINICESWTKQPDCPACSKIVLS